MITAAAAPAESVVESVLRALDWGVDRVQLRMPERSGRPVEDVLDAILARSKEAAGRLLVNDRFDLAFSYGVSGVHLPAHGLPAMGVRERVPDGFRICVSTHSAPEVAAAAVQGADFVVFGPVFPSASKPGHPGLGLQALRSVVQRATVPVYALGGITLDRIDEVAATGVHGVAGISMFENEHAVRSLVSPS